MAKATSRATKAPRGERMIEVNLRFWTDKIADEGAGYVIPKHAWGFGVARIERNESHGIEPGRAVHFHSLMELGAAVEKVLIAHGVRLLLPPKMQKYVSESAE